MVCFGTESISDKEYTSINYFVDVSLVQATTLVFANYCLATFTAVPRRCLLTEPGPGMEESANEPSAALAVKSMRIASHQFADHK